MASPLSVPGLALTMAQFEFMGGAFYKNVVRLSKHITLNQARAIFGFNDSTNIGRIHFGSRFGALGLLSSLLTATRYPGCNKLGAYLPTHIWG